MATNILALENQLCFSVYSAAHAFTRTYRPLLARLGVTYPQYLVLLVLWERRHASVGEIGQLLGLDSGTLSPLLKRLEKTGHVRRVRDRADERLVHIHLTDQGATARQDALDVARQIGLAVGCSSQQFIRMREELRSLTERLNASNDGVEAKLVEPRET